MVDWGLNPSHGWAYGPWAETPPGFFPAPPGMGWFELPADGMSASENWSHIRGAGWQTGPYSTGWYELPAYGAGTQYVGPGPCCSFGGGGPVPPAPVYSAPVYPSAYAPFPAGQYAYHGPENSDGMPAMNLNNPFGGIGNPPGANYFFPPNHCKIFVIKHHTPPWLNENPVVLPYKEFTVPTNITVQELMKGFGCDNEDPAKNVMYECVRAANGKWYRDKSFEGDNEGKMGKRIEDVGWNKDRNGVKEDCVWLWFQK